MRKLLIVLIGLLATVLVTGAPTASAEPFTALDKAYVAALYDAGMGVYLTDGGVTAVVLGHGIAAELRANPAPDTLRGIILRGINAEIPYDDVITITATAIVYYAPELLPYIELWASQPT